uniref:Cytochrome c oxidase subunit 6B (Fragments) n=1 Tax=Thunnus obesus TaxID=8241 RepID=COX6B_THUOB|nr:RecName: Full=Cytochrome c oxidase subunit 6B; AltName: Full=Cytochrome c oxidase subunit VIb; Short=COX VIb [Thunnus obesus]
KALYAPFDATFPNQNQTRNKAVDTAPCEWYRRVY